MDTAHGSEWMARLRVGLATLALIAACRRGEPTTSGPPANVPGPDAAEPRSSVEIVERPPLATYPALDIRAVYPDGDVLVVPPEERTAQMALERRGPGGVLRWRTVWKDHRDFHVAVTARDTWVLALGERPLRVSPRTQLAIDDPGPNPLVLARLRSADGVIEATTVLVPHIPFEDRQDGLRHDFAVPDDAGGVFVAGPDPELDPLRKYDHALTLLATIRVPKEATAPRWPGDFDVSTRGEVCLRPSAPRPPALRPRSLWCLEPNLTGGRFIPYPDDADEVWHDGPRIVGGITTSPASGYRVGLTLPARPTLTIESACRWREERSLWEAFQALGCDHDCPPPPCQEATIHLKSVRGDSHNAMIAFDFVATISIADQPVETSVETIAVLRLALDLQPRLQVHRACYRATFVPGGRYLVYCKDGVHLASLQ